MRKSVRVAILLVLSCFFIATCSQSDSNSQTVPSYPSSNQTSASDLTQPKEEFIVPDVVDDLFWDGVNELNDLGEVNVQLREVDVLEGLLGVELIDDPNNFPELDEYTIRETDPEFGEIVTEGGTIGIYLTPPLPEAAKGKTWQAQCGEEIETYFGLHEILEYMANNHGSSCETSLIPGAAFAPTEKQKKLLALAHKSEYYGTDTEFNDLLNLCTKSELATWDQGDRYLFGAAAQICPESPLAETLKSWGEGSIFEDGNYEVGSEIPAGVYVSTSPAENCYWERATAHGEIIDNDFITFARDGAKTKLTGGESFHSENCGTWSRRK